MNYLILALGIILFFLVLFILKSAKKHIVITLIKMTFFFALIFIVLIVLGGYVDLTNLFSQNSKIVQTGAAVIDVVKSSIN
ncbi:MAG: hypothetical protein KKA65_00285 [Nanoarchaeota archaeon]|nr:hypothetical protein [Nanoarchaeota archaeon]MBU4242364.1 hypothetical protein [Nanoarchaeota archaeon]MBU4352160.1 hypothetical protein [Nanoarchaeota archaeon]MBU4455922.1 hypothetical protein [Nanoarchaeota archaeon]MCG2719816.1 hypothetical protein [Nanoarchaeota archaeon]